MQTPKFFFKIKSSIENFLHNEELKRKLYTIIFEADTKAGKRFDVLLMVFILLSVLVVVVESLEVVANRFKLVFQVFEYVFTGFFTIEYLVRIYCSPKPKKYIFSFFGIVDLISTLPMYLGFLFQGARYFIIFRTFRLIRVFRVFKLFTFISEGHLLLKSLYESSRKIIVFFLFVIILVVSIGTLMYMIEGTTPNTQFTDIPTSIYWAIVTMTTVGYGDITPVTTIGRALSAFVMLLGYTIIAVPTGIVSAEMVKGYKKQAQKKCVHCGKSGHEADASFCKYCGESLNDL